MLQDGENEENNSTNSRQLFSNHTTNVDRRSSFPLRPIDLNRPPQTAPVERKLQAFKQMCHNARSLPQLFSSSESHPFQPNFPSTTFTLTPPTKRRIKPFSPTDGPSPDVSPTRSSCCPVDRSSTYSESHSPSLQPKTRQKLCRSSSENMMLNNQASHGPNRYLYPKKNLDESNEMMKHLSPMHKQVPPELVTDESCFTYITPEMIVSLMEGVIPSIQHYLIIDCRYEYEFRGGHIENAMNISTFEQLEDNFMKDGKIKTLEKLAIIFHCEFSSHRGPRMAQALRSWDRGENNFRYPKLFYPNIFIMEGGYKKFYEEFEKYCTPARYVQMNDKLYAQEYKEAKQRSADIYGDLKKKSSSWNSGLDLRDLCQSPSSFPKEGSLRMTK